MAAKRYDVVVIGSGAGAIVVDRAVFRGDKVALIDKGPLGGTCLNVGCIPSKMLIYPADVIAQAHDASRLGVSLSVDRIDFAGIMARMRRVVQGSQHHIRHSIQDTKGLDFYEAEARFVGERELEVQGKRIKGDKVFIAAGARPYIPPIPGLAHAGYLTNETVLGIEALPRSIVIIGGGYVAAEYAHFFSAMGSEVTMLEQSYRLVAGEEPEVALLLRRRLARRLAVLTNTEAIEVRGRDGRVSVRGRNLVTGEDRWFEAERILVATGRVSNADRLDVAATGVQTDARGYVRADGRLETGVNGVWAFGDIIGRHMYTHVANQEAVLAWHNAIHEHKVEMDYSAVPHAIFTDPQIAAVGLTQAEAAREHDILIGQAPYMSVAYGEAMLEEDGFAKAVVEKDTGRILGFHIIGPHASILIQEVVDVMANGGNANSITAAMHIHPALSELIAACVHNLREPQAEATAAAPADADSRR